MQKRYYNDITSKKTSLIKIINGNEAVINDCIDTPLNTFILNWLLSFDTKDVPPEYKSYIRTHHDKLVKRLFVVRDLYKYFNLPDKELKYKITPSNYVWFNILMSEEFRNIKTLVEGRDNLCRILANVIASYINNELKTIAQQIAQIANEAESFDTQNIQNKNNNQNNQNNQSNENNNSNTQDTLNQFISNLSKNNTISVMCEKIKNGIGYIKGELINQIGKEAGIIKFDNNEILNVNLQKDILQKIKNIGSNFYDFYKTEDKMTQVTSNIPKQIDLSLADETIMLEKIANSSFIYTEPKSTIKIDLYLDVSGSMDNKKIKLAKGVIKELLKYKIKFNKIYAFNSKLTEIKTLKELFQISPDGGTDINKVLDNIEKHSKKALIISDLEDDVDKNKISKLANKISLVYVSSIDYYYEKYWQNSIKALAHIKP